MIKLTKNISSEDLEELTLRIIGVIDYDIEKEMRLAIELWEKGEEDYPREVEELSTYLENII